MEVLALGLNWLGWPDSETAPVKALERCEGAAEGKFRLVTDAGCDFRQPPSGVLQPR
jgi:hypothetical protein